MRPSIFKKKRNQGELTESLKEEILSTYEEIGILPLYEKIFLELEKKMETLKNKLIEKDGLSSTQAEEIIAKAKQEAQVEIISKVNKRYVELLKEAEESKKWNHI